MIRFGHLLGLHGAAGANYFDTVRKLAAASEAAGLDAVFYSDHLMSRLHRPHVARIWWLLAALRRRRLGGLFASTLAGLALRLDRRAGDDPERTLPTLECFTTLAALAATTRRIRLGALVAAVPYRNPALLARMNANLDLISHGRCIVGLGAGWQEEEFRAYGWRFPSARARAEQLDEAAQIISAMLSQPHTRFRGAHFRLDHALSYPPPVQRPRPPLLIGASGERRTLRTAARYADYSNILGDPATVARKIAVLHAHCAAVGRPAEAITLTNLVSILIARSEAELARKRRSYHHRGGHPVEGTPARVVEQLRAYIAVGVRYIIFTLPDAHNLEPLALFTETVIPALAEEG
jgi:alkanesulfonate monooxygenase SsuD/methylene tetrahydromethanopterin reductase-like flavin-dependent oxidoreductase (luciferase family)